MPYITPQRKEAFAEFKHAVDELRVDSPGELNYLVTMLALAYLNQHGETYRTLNEVIGAMECAKFELYRRRVTPLEESKREENGDVFAPPIRGHE